MSPEGLGAENDCAGSCERQTHPLVQEGSPHQQTSNSLTIIKNWSQTTDGYLTPRRIGRLTAGRNINLTLTFWSVENVRESSPWVSLESHQPTRTGAIEHGS
jgi:hypothetical protein